VSIVGVAETLAGPQRIRGKVVAADEGAGEGAGAAAGGGAFGASGDGGDSEDGEPTPAAGEVVVQGWTASGDGAALTGAGAWLDGRLGLSLRCERACSVDKTVVGDDPDPWAAVTASVELFDRRVDRAPPAPSRTPATESAPTTTTV